MYNLAIGNIQNQNYKNAAHHLISALTLQQENVNKIKESFGEEISINAQMNGVSSDSIWSILRMVMTGYLQKTELNHALTVKDLDTLKNTIL